MRTPIPWLMTELADLRRAYAEMPNISPAQLEQRFPRHDFKSIIAKQMELRIKRDNGARRYKPGWAAVVEIVGAGLKSRQEIADTLGCSRANVAEILGSMRGQWHVGGWRPSGYYAVMTPLVKLGTGQDMPRPKKAAEKVKTVNPFLVAGGMVKPHETITGRIIKQDMTIHSDELEAA